MTSSGLSRSREDYLKAVHTLSERGKAVGTNDLARALDVQPASVSGMIRRLAEDGLLEHEPYAGVRLTERGNREALKVLRRHRIIESFLVRRLDFSWDDVHEEAERLEHAASDRLIDRMAEALDNPTTDPHGAPIPTRSGEMDPTTYRRLNEVPSGTRVTVRSVSDQDPGQLRSFEAAGLVPGADVLIQSWKRRGSVTLTVQGRQELVALSPEEARRVRVTEG